MVVWVWVWGGGCGCGHGESNSCTKRCILRARLSFHLCLSNQLFSVIAVWSAKQIGGCGEVCVGVVVRSCVCGEVCVWGGVCGEVCVCGGRGLPHSSNRTSWATLEFAVPLS